MVCPYCGGDSKGYQIIGSMGYDANGDYVALSECLSCGKEFIQIYAVEIDWDNPIENIKKEEYKEE